MIKKHVYLLLLLLASTSLIAQDYVNTWIDYDQTYYKFEVEDDGLTRIPFSTIEAAGLPLDAAGFKLIRKGVEVPIYVSTNGSLGTTDYIEFVGEKNDGTFDTQLFMDPEHQLTDVNSLFTDKIAYYLIWDDSEPHLRFLDAANVVSNPPPKETQFDLTFRRILDNGFFEGAPDTRELAGVNSYLSNFGVCEGFVGSKVGPGLQQDYSLLTDNAYLDDNQMAQIEVRVVGRSNDVFIASGDHHIQLRFNGELYYDGIYDGYDCIKVEFDVPVSEMGNSNTLTLKSVGDIWNSQFSNASIDANSLAYIFVTYPHTYDFNNRRSLEFTIENDQDRYVEIENFNGGGSPIVYDLDNNLRLIPFLENGVYKVRLNQMSFGPEKRRIFITNTTSTLSVNEVDNLTERTFTNFADPVNAADFIILTHNKLMVPDEIDNENQIERYKAYRESQDGGGHKVLAVDVDELYDQFSYGIRQHPVGIQQFVNFIKEQASSQNWSIDPEHLFLVGKSLRYSYCTNSPSDFEDNLVPTYGSSGSDNMLAAPSKFTYINQMSVGRLSARTPNDVREYLDKAIEYEAWMNLDSPCDMEQLAWLKELIHIGSGNDEDEAMLFGGFLDKYKTIVQDSLYGGNVVLTLSSETQAIIPTPTAVEDKINSGIGVITFVGHSNGEFWSYDLRTPDFYENEGKYPFIVSSSCFVGDIHQPFSEESRIMAEIYTTFPDRGSIGFLASVKFGFPTYLDLFTEALYRNFSKDHYGEGMGKVIRHTIEDIYDSEEIGVQITAQEFTLSGDPAIPLYSFDRPEYAISEADVSIEPAVLTADLNSFDVQVIVKNYGQAISDSISIAVERTFPNGANELISNTMVLAPILQDTFLLTVPNTGDEVLGTNSIKVSVDYGNKQEEYCESNNDVIRNIQVLPTTAIPIDPCDFAIVNEQEITLRASTASPLVDRQNYVLQIDTSMLFTSILDSEVVESLGGVIEWTPDIVYTNNTVYYWRIALQQEEGVEEQWQGHSFTYITDHPDGWNQQHYYQYGQNEFTDLRIDEDSRLFEYGGSTNFLRVVNGYIGLSSISGNSISYYLNGNALANNSCLNTFEEFGCAGGIMFAVFAPDTVLVPMESIQQPFSTIPETVCDLEGQFGNTHCGNSSTSPVFQFPTGTEEQLLNLIAFLDQIPDDHYVLAYSINNHHMENDQALISLQEEVYDFFAEMGADNISDISNTLPFVVFGRKGNADYGAAVEEIATASDQILDIDINVNEAFGEMYSRDVGPASAWKEIIWDFTSLDPQPTDEISVDVYGYKLDGTREFLFNTSTEQNVDISDVNAEEFPRLQLQLKTADYTYITAPQLDFWRVTFVRYTELALNENLRFEFCCDTLASGEYGSFAMGITNASNITSDSINIAYSIIDANNVTHELEYDLQAPLAPGESFDTELQFVGASSGQNILVINLNPDGAQNEKYSFNNVLQLPFWVGSDNINPIVDVTFDGEHILSGDIVSPEPFVEVKIRDENPQLALNDTSIATMWLIYPGGEERELSYAQDNITLIGPEASEVATQNEASITFTPDLYEDGRYQLVVRGRDISGNLAAATDYVIAFEVIREAMISNVINYPNPFTTSTQFVFTLTGTEVPDNLKIQVMTISGKVVREITLEELGDVKIGKNLSDFRWDGTDQFGNELANGVYFYRVVASDAGEDLKLFTNPDGKYNMSGTENMDRLFSSKGIGKMYKMR